MQERTASFLEDVEFLVSTGETHAESVAARLGSRPKIVIRRLERHGRSDLIARIDTRYSDFVQGKRA
jgi:hypothetical protein